MGTFLSRLVLLGLSICMFTGCATLIFDRYDKVDIVTEPAGVEIYDSEGFNIGIAPVQIPFKRLPQQHLTLRMDGYVDTTVVMSTSINPWGYSPLSCRSQRNHEHVSRFDNLRNVASSGSSDFPSI